MEIIEGFISNNIGLEWLMIMILPVLPTELRPMIVLDDDILANPDLNVLYKHIINENNKHFNKKNK